jgi:uncharacterized membrane protein YbhN (UPF0104 family)
MVDRKRALAVGRWVGSLAVMIGMAWWVDFRAVAARLAHLDGRWVATHFVLSMGLYVVLAGRWWYTAGRLGAPLTFKRAYMDYYLSTLLNQLLPLGVAGDLVRVARHGGGPAARAIVIERISGFLGLALFVAASAVVWLTRGRPEFVPVGAGALGLLAAGGLAALVIGRRAARRGDGGRGRAALLARGPFAIQLLVSSLAIVLLMVLFTCAGRAAGAHLDLVTVVEVVPLVLAATALPWAFGGWGAREATCAALYQLLGLDAATGVAVSISFGLLSLLAATPGVIALLLPRGEPQPVPVPVPVRIDE